MKFLALCLLFTVTSYTEADEMYRLEPPLTPINFDVELNDVWESFKKLFNKSYNEKEEIARRIIWEQTVGDVIRHNLEADMGMHSYRLEINKFSDMSYEEFKKYNGLRIKSESSNFVGNGSTWMTLLNFATAPESLDWRKEGYVTEVKDQKECGSCWAFSATGSLEGQHFKKTGKLVSLSEQNLVDCSQKQGNEGCDGGWMDKAFQYVKDNKGIDSEKSYPYTGSDGDCHFKKRNVGATCTGFVDLPTGDENALLQAVATIGPISVGINTAGYFRSYSDGIYNNENCGNAKEDLSHGVLVVGYGSQDGKDYWIVKNSWGADWGMNGYILMSRNKNNQCGIATTPSYPLV